LCELDFIMNRFEGVLFEILNLHSTYKCIYVCVCNFVYSLINLSSYNLHLCYINKHIYVKNSNEKKIMA
jgi:hypothetical protein